MNRHSRHQALCASATSLYLAALILGCVAAATVAVAAPPQTHVYPVAGYFVRDADTIRTLLELGFGIEVNQLARVAGIDTPEQNTSAGKAVTKYVKTWCDSHAPLYAQWISADKYGGRYVAIIYDRDGNSLTVELLKRRFAHPFTGREAKLPWSRDELDRIEQAADRATRELTRQP